MNELTNFEYILIVVSLLVAAWLIWPNKPLNSGFKNGFDYANTTFDEHNFRNAIKELQGYVEESKTWHEYDDFDKGIEQGIKERKMVQCLKLNEHDGGDWYFCNESLKFKDSLTSREIIL